MKKSKAKILADAIEGSLVMLSVLIYIILGITIGWWHPGWIIVVATCMITGIASIIVKATVDVKAFDAKAEVKDEPEKK